MRSGGKLKPNSNTRRGILCMCAIQTPGNLQLVCYWSHVTIVNSHDQRTGCTQKRKNPQLCGGMYVNCENVTFVSRIAWNSLGYVWNAQHSSSAQDQAIFISGLIKK
ncbi:hypothetical protein M8J77_000451 [Diaphorina citri]|nr:hypothetical protein M8J77_000451 [Diaphorina citri]